MVDKKQYIRMCYLFCSIFLISCSEKMQVNPNSTFRYEDLNDSYDSNTATFSRRYSDDTVRIKIVLTQGEKEKVLHSFSENKFQNFPSEIDCSSWGAHPKIYDELSLNSSSIRYIHNVDNSWFCLSGKRFDRINKVLKDIILNKPEIKKLEPSDIAYE